MASIIRRASGNDYDRIMEFVKSAEEQSEEIGKHPENYFLMENESRQLQAIAGFRFARYEGVVRTLIIDTDTCSVEEVLRFVTELLEYAQKKGLGSLYMVTPSPDLFKVFGFETVKDGEAPVHLLDKHLVEQSVRAGARVMMKSFVDHSRLEQ